MAVGQAADHQGRWTAGLLKAEKNVKLLRRVCRRISYIEKHIRERQELPPVTANDIIGSLEYESIRRRVVAASKGTARLNKLNADHGHLNVQIGDPLYYKCYKCGGSALGNSSAYWHNRECTTSGPLATGANVIHGNYSRLAQAVPGSGEAHGGAIPQTAPGPFQTDGNNDSSRISTGRACRPSFYKGKQGKPKEV